MPLCTCTKCKASTSGVGKDVHRTTVARHMQIEQAGQDLENAYQIFHPEENYPEEKNWYKEENSREECSSPMEISDNEASGFQNEENKEASYNFYENDDRYYENDDLIYDSQSDLEFDGENSNAGDNEGEFQSKLLLMISFKYILSGTWIALTFLFVSMVLAR